MTGWFCSFFLQPPGPGMSAQYRQSMEEIILRLSRLEFPCNIISPFLQLLRHFEIGAIHDNRYCWLAGLLPVYTYWHFTLADLSLKVQRMLFIRTKHSMQIFRVSPFIKLQNKT